jgi:hypothetical protein
MGFYDEIEAKAKSLSKSECGFVYYENDEGTDVLIFGGDTRCLFNMIIRLMKRMAKAKGCKVSDIGREFIEYTKSLSKKSKNNTSRTTA